MSILPMSTSILLVEDERTITLDVTHRLKRLGYPQPAVANTGEDAVRLALSLRPSIILMDIVLGEGMDGIEAASRIRAEMSVPIIYLTAHADPLVLQRAKVTEPFGYLLKPFEDRELLTCIEMALYKHRMDTNLRRKERWFSTTLGSIADAVVAVNSKGQITYLNDSAENLLGFPVQQVAHKPFADLIRITTTDGAPFPGNPTNIVCQCDNCTGREQFSGSLHTTRSASVPIDVTVTGLMDDAGNCNGAVLVIHDATERHKAEEALRNSLNVLQRTLRETVKALAATSEKRDPYTAGHQSRVAQLACALGQHLQLSADNIEGLRVAALLHDIGKINVPAEILAKPTRLSDLEMAIMRQHSQVGYDILREINFPWPVAEIVYQHHERLDGTGYPRSLAGADILPEASIVSVADVVEAMSSHRPYRPALGLAEALAEVQAGSGTRYASHVVEACCTLFTNGFTFE